MKASGSLAVRLLSTAKLSSGKPTKSISWHDNGQKDDESIYKDGDQVDRSLWDRRGKKREEEKEVVWGGSSYGDDPFEELGLTDDDRSLGRAFWKNIL